MGNANHTRVKLEEKKEKNRLAQQRHRKKLKDRIAYLESLVGQSSEALPRQVKDETLRSSTLFNIKWTSEPVQTGSIKIEDDPAIELSDFPTKNPAQEASTARSNSDPLQDAWAMRNWGSGSDNQDTEIPCLAVPDTAVHQPEPWDTATTLPFMDSESEAFNFEMPAPSLSEGVATPNNLIYGGLPISPASVDLDQLDYTQGSDAEPTGLKMPEGADDPLFDPRGQLETSTESKGSTSFISDDLQEQLQSPILRRNGFTLRIAELSMDGAQTVQVDHNEDSMKQSTLATLLEKILCA